MLGHEMSSLIHTIGHKNFYTSVSLQTHLRNVQEINAWCHTIILLDRRMKLLHVILTW